MENLIMLLRKKLKKTIDLELTPRSRVVIESQEREVEGLNDF